MSERKRLTPESATRGDERRAGWLSPVELGGRGCSLMRVKRWAPAPVPHAPAPPRPAAAAAPRPRPPSPPRLDRRRNRKPAARPQPSTSQERLEQYQGSVWPTVQRVRDLLRPLARPDPAAKPPPLRQQLSTHIVHELVQRRAACAQIHALVRHARNKAAATAAASTASTASDRKGKGRARDDDLEQGAAAAAAAAAQLPPWIERQVVHLVAQTMRLQLHLGDVSSAKELDRAFFSLEPPAAAKRAFRLSRAAQQPDAKAARALRLGTGLGLDRGDVEPAWMQSLAVRLRAGADPARALERFLGLYGAFRASRVGAHERGAADWEAYVRARTARQDEQDEGGSDERGDERLGESHVLAFLARRMGTLQRRVETAASRLSPWRAQRVHAQLRAFMDELRAAEEDEGEVVALALLESSLERLEASEHLELDDPLYRQVEEDVERLVASVGDVLAAPSLDAARGAVRGSAPSRRPDWVELERRAQALHIAIRFLLVRARSLDDRSSSHASTSTASPTSTTASPLASASQLYLLLLDLTHSTASDPLLATTALPRLRLRQSSVLFRLVSAHLDALAAAQHRQRRPHSPSPSDDPLAPLERLRTLLSTTLSTLSRIPPSPAVPPSTRRLDLSTHVLRAALLALGSAFDLSNPARKDAMPRFDAVRDACDVLLQCKEHDAELRRGPLGPVGLALSPPPGALVGQSVGVATAVDQPQLPQKGRVEQPLLRRRDAAGALVRAALLAESSSSSSAGSGSGSGSEPGALAAQDDVCARLDWLLDWIARLQRASPAPEAAAAPSGSVRAPPGHPTTTERKARRTVARAVRATVERAWGTGEGGRAWREGLLRRVDEWVDEGEREWAALEGQGEVRRVLPLFSCALVGPTCSSLTPPCAARRRTHRRLAALIASPISTSPFARRLSGPRPSSRHLPPLILLSHHRAPHRST